MKKVGILTWHYYPNFGSALQCWALQQTIEALGHKVEVINYRNPKYGLPDKWASLKYILSRSLGECNHAFNYRFKYPFLLFQKRFLHETKAFTDVHYLSKIDSDYHCIVYGSDQIWAPNVFNPIYMGKYISCPEVKKISYAASLGLPNIPSKLIMEYQSLLHNFHAVSVRENTGKELLKRDCNIEASLVLDPTFLIHVDQYKQLEHRVPNIKKPYIFCYFLNKNHTYHQAVSDYAQKKGYSIVGYSANPNDAAWVFMPKGIGPQEFLWLISHAETVITDSYHGSIFSLLYHKHFFCMERFQYNDPICQNSRIWQLNDYFNIEKCIIKQGEAIREYSYDYQVFENLLSSYRKISIDFLIKSLQ